MNHLLNTFFSRWNRSLPTFGQLAIAAFHLALFSGIALALPYDVRFPYESLQVISLGNEGAAFFRGLHYWGGQLFLLAVLFHVVEHLEEGTERKVNSGVWLRLVVSIPCTFFVMLTGFMLKGDGEGMLARRIFGGLLQTVPMIGKMADYAVAGNEGDFQILYVHHILTMTIMIFIVMVEHTRRIWASSMAMITILSLSAFLTPTAPPSLHDIIDPVVKGPWYFLGLQEILHWTAYPFWVLFGLAMLLLLFWKIPSVTANHAALLKKTLAAAWAGYSLLCIIGWLFRGENWRFQMPFF